MKIWDMQQEYGIIKQFLILLKSIKSQLENIRKPESYIFNKSKCTCMYVCMYVCMCVYMILCVCVCVSSPQNKYSICG